MPAPRANTPRLQSPVEQHAEWLGLLRPEGPFLALPVLTAALPQGLDTVPDVTRAWIRQAWAEVSEAPDLLGPAWQELIIGELLRYPASALRGDAALRGDGALRGVRPDVVASGPDSVTRLHVYRRGFDEPLTGAAHGQPALAERAAQLCRDYATAQAYAWGDLDLGHGFHDTRQGRRFTIAPDVQVEVLDRLLELNHERYAEEIRQGLHTKKKAQATKKTQPNRTKNTVERPVPDGRAEPEDILF